jgi:riboflavin transporter FmnP
VQQSRFGKFDTVSLAGTAVFGALAVVLTIVSQALGLNFPIVPYLQFDFGEIAIFLSFYIFGPIPAIISTFIEFLVLMAIGQNVPVGPVLKLLAVLSSLAGLWLGISLLSKSRRRTLTSMTGAGIIIALISRVAVMSAANYYLIVFLFTVPGIVGFLTASFKLIGVALDEKNALGLVLGVTAFFNVLQLLLGSIVSFLLIRLPQVRATKAAGRPLWIVANAQTTNQDAATG